MIRTSLQRRFRRNFAAAVLIVSALACDDATGSIPFEAAGSYSLVHVNGAPLPARIAESPDETTDLVSGRLVVNYDGNYREEQERRVTDSSGVRTSSRITEGTIQVGGAVAELRERDGATHTGSFARSPAATEISYTAPAGTGDATYTYRKN